MRRAISKTKTTTACCVVGQRCGSRLVVQVGLRARTAFADRLRRADSAPSRITPYDQGILQQEG